jgi:hypothetical protein
LSSLGCYISSNLRLWNSQRVQASFFLHHCSAQLGYEQLAAGNNRRAAPGGAREAFAGGRLSTVQSLEWRDIPALRPLGLAQKPEAWWVHVSVHGGGHTFDSQLPVVQLRLLASSWVALVEQTRETLHHAVKQCATSHKLTHLHVNATSQAYHKSARLVVCAVAQTSIAAFAVAAQ